MGIRASASRSSPLWGRYDLTVAPLGVQVLSDTSFESVFGGDEWGSALRETVILAIGGNALAPAGLGDFAEQEERARVVARTAVRATERARSS